MTNNNSDTAWKEILDFHIKDCIDFCFPDLSKLIDWEKNYISLDKEMQSITRQSEVGSKIIDKLFKVHLKNGKEQWMLIHLEIQNEKDANFAKRMFIYAYRIFDRYDRQVISCAILTDTHSKWAPSSYEVGFAGSYLKAQFLIIKILDYKSRLKELEESNNIFASVIYVQLKAIENKFKPNEEKKRIKFLITKHLFEKGFAKETVHNLYRFIDWLIGLPELLELEYYDEVHDFTESKKMAYISFIERKGMEKGIQQGKLQGIEQGKLQGIQQGKLQGIEQGKLQGIQQSQLEIAERLLAENMPISFIHKVTGLSLEKISEMQEKKVSI